MDKKYKIVLAVFAICICGISYLYVNHSAENNLVVTESFSDSKPLSENSPTPTEVSTQESGAIYIHICGQVNKPGVYVFKSEPRVIDVVNKAGGFRKKADTTSINLAESVTDGTKIVIEKKGVKKAASKDDGMTDSGRTGASLDKININTASKEELMTLSGIGESKATQIISYRETNGSFKKCEDIMNISGIKEGVYSKIKDMIAV